MDRLDLEVRAHIVKLEHVNQKILIFSKSVFHPRAEFVNGDTAIMIKSHIFIQYFQNSGQAKLFDYGTHKLLRFRYILISDRKKFYSQRRKKLMFMQFSLKI